MTIQFAVDRLYSTGWLPSDQMELPRLPSGLRYPTVAAVKKEFADAGVELSVKPNVMFNCCRAEWGTPLVDGPHGTVVGSCEEEAAVFALAKLREQQAGMKSSVELATV